MLGNTVGTTTYTISFIRSSTDIGFGFATALTTTSGTASLSFTVSTATQTQNAALIISTALPTFRDTFNCYYTTDSSGQTVNNLYGFFSTNWYNSWQVLLASQKYDWAIAYNSSFTVPGNGGGIQPRIIPPIQPTDTFGSLNSYTNFVISKNTYYGGAYYGIHAEFAWNPTPASLNIGSLDLLLNYNNVSSYYMCSMSSSVSRACPGFTFLAGKHKTKFIIIIFNFN